jgi:hypothetical protein
MPPDVVPNFDTGCAWSVFQFRIDTRAGEGSPPEIMKWFP